MEAFLQNIACHIFQEAAQKKRHNEGRAYGEFQWGQPLYHDGDQRRTGAVDWEPRAGQKAAVDETVKLKVLQCDLDAPAKESIGKKNSNIKFIRRSVAILQNSSEFYIRLLQPVYLSMIRRDHIPHTRSQCGMPLFHLSE